MVMCTWAGNVYGAYDDDDMVFRGFSHNEQI